MSMEEVKKELITKWPNLGKLVIREWPTSTRLSKIFVRRSML